MFKTLSAALIAASMLIAPIASNAAQPATKTEPAAKAVTVVKTHKRHIVKHHARHKFAKHARHHSKLASHKRHGKFAAAHVRHGQFVKTHARHGKLVFAHKHHGKIVKITKVQKRITPKKVRTGAL